MGMNWLFNPTTTAPSRAGKSLANRIDQPSAQATRTFEPGGYMGQYEDFANKLQGQIRGGIAGSIEGAGNLMSDMTSPIGIASSVAGMPWMRNLMRGGSGAMRTLGRMDDIPQGQGISPTMLPSSMVPRGGEDVYNAGRSIYNPARKTLEETAYNTVRTGNDPIRKQIGGSFNLAEAMRRSNLR